MLNNWFVGILVLRCAEPAISTRWRLPNQVAGLLGSYAAPRRYVIIN